LRLEQLPDNSVTSGAHIFRRGRGHGIEFD